MKMRSILIPEGNHAVIRISFVCFLCASLLSYSSSCQTIEYGDNPKSGHFAQNQGVNIYYETYGSGDPLVILHGNGGSISARSSQIEKFSKKYFVIAMDNRCHGKSDCPSGEVTFEQMADDMNSILEYLNLSDVNVWGHSDGGNIALLMGISNPTNFKKIVVSGANLRPDTTAVDPAVLPLIAHMEKDADGDPLKSKRLKLLTEQPNISKEMLKQIEADVLVMAGDRDIIRHEHTLEIFEAITNSFLCILPGSTHMIFQERALWFDQIVDDFFTQPQIRHTTVQAMQGTMIKH